MIVKYNKTKAHQRYVLRDGTRVPGSSTVCKLGDDPSALLYWAWSLGIEGKDYKVVREQAADIGSLAHFMVENYLNGNESDLSEFSADDRDKAETCYLKFLEFWERESLTPIAPELQLVSETHGYGGTLDLICRDKRGDVVLLDWKSSKAIYPSMLIQLVSYEQLWNNAEIQMVGGKCCDRVKSLVDTPVARRAIVRIGKKEQGDFEVRWLSDLSNYFEIFKAQLQLYKALKKIK